MTENRDEWQLFIGVRSIGQSRQSSFYYYESFSHVEEVLSQTFQVFLYKEIVRLALQRIN